VALRGIAYILAMYSLFIGIANLILAIFMSSVEMIASTKKKCGSLMIVLVKKK